jgi:pyruvate formate lyase activating enzyme
MTLQTAFAELHTRSVDAEHLLGRVHSFETMGTVDGPGTRFVVFMQGCVFRCRYCHNRDTWDTEAGKLYSVTDLITEILPYIPFIDASGGGVTVSGGEPILQREFVRVLFKMLNFQGIHTCLDTNGYVPPHLYDEEMEKFVRCTDLFLLDIKQMDEQKHIRLTEVSNQHTLRFARYLHERKRPVWIRHVVVPGYSDDPDDIRKLAEFVAPMENVQKVELLPYHTLGVHKWAACGEPYPLEGVEPPGREKMLELKAIFDEFGIAATI